jgi:hypothetical protein
MSDSDGGVQVTDRSKPDGSRMFKVFRKLIGVGSPKSIKVKRESPHWKIHSSDQPIGRDEFWSWSNEEAIEKIRDLNLGAYDAQARSSLSKTTLGGAKS